MSCAPSGPIRSSVLEDDWFLSRPFPFPIRATRFQLWNFLSRTPSALVKLQHHGPGFEQLSTSQSLDFLGGGLLPSFLCFALQPLFIGAVISLDTCRVLDFNMNLNMDDFSTSHETFNRLGYAVEDDDFFVMAVLLYLAILWTLVRLRVSTLKARHGFQQVRRDINYLGQAEEDM